MKGHATLRSFRCIPCGMPLARRQMRFFPRFDYFYLLERRISIILGRIERLLALKCIQILIATGRIRVPVLGHQYPEGVVLVRGQAGLVIEHLVRRGLGSIGIHGLLQTPSR